MWKLQDQSLMLIFASHKLVKEGFLDFFYYGNSNSVLRITFNNHSTTDKKREIWPVWLAHFSLWARNLGFSSLNTKTRDITADSHFKSPNRSSAKKKKKGPNRSAEWCVMAHRFPRYLSEFILFFYYYYYYYYYLYKIEILF